MTALANLQKLYRIAAAELSIDESKDGYGDAGYCLDAPELLPGGGMHRNRLNTEGFPALQNFTWRH